jgi:asparagine synthase (glutamine-hydrolysing)
MPPSLWSGAAAGASFVVPELAHVRDAGAKVRERANLFGSGSATQLYGGIVSIWLDPGALVIGATEPSSLATGATSPLRGLSLFEQLMAADMVTYLPDDILVKVDRAAMAVSLETRVPLLDHRVVEFAWRIPLEYKVRDGQTKWILRHILRRHIPNELIERPKMGFGVPIGEWLRGPLRDWAEALLDERRLTEEGYFRPKPIRRAWETHLRGVSGGEHRLWTVLMFQSWLEEQGAAAAASAGLPLAESHARGA